MTQESKTAKQHRHGIYDYIAEITGEELTPYQKGQLSDKLRDYVSDQTKTLGDLVKSLSKTREQWHEDRKKKNVIKRKKYIQRHKNKLI